ncbi:MAG TPA: hypothetical protein VN462_07635 [Negativicutes bacterium]|nr:hypothetical protein [Negativicutes bacterium]
MWFVCNGTVEPYSGQDANWTEAVVVSAGSPEEALLKVMKYHLGKLPCSRAVYDGKEIRVIT